MKFGVRECANIVFRAKQQTKIGNTTFNVGQPVLYIDTATTSSVEQSTSTEYANGGRGNPRLIAWEGDRTLTFTIEDALLSPIGFSILSGAGLFKSDKGSTEKVHYHMTSTATIDSEGKLDLTDALVEFGASEGKGRAAVCTKDAPIYVLGVEDDGSINGEIYTWTGKTETAGTSTVSGVTYESVLTGFVDADKAEVKGKNVMVDYYIDLPGEQVYEADITADTFGGYYYVEADTLFRRQSDGKDMPANLTFPNAKIQSNFTLTMSGSGTPSTFTFTLDAFPGYTYFDKTKKVLCVLQIVEDAVKSASTGKPVMPHDDVHQHDAEGDGNDIFDAASNVNVFASDTTNHPRASAD